VEDHVLTEVVAEHVLMCFRSQDPQVTLELVVQGPVVKTREASRVGVQDTAKLVAMQFEHQAKERRAPCFFFWPLDLFLFVNKLCFISAKCCFFAIVFSQSLASQGHQTHCLCTNVLPIEHHSNSVYHSGPLGGVARRLWL
jgi:hypothetical protein